MTHSHVLRKILKGASVLIGIGSVSCFVLVIFGRILLSLPPLPNYDSLEVQRICTLLDLDLSYSFCANPATQDADTLLSVLKAKFPLGRTAYHEIIPYFASLPAKPLGSCSPSINESFRLNNCPPPEDCRNEYEKYDCIFNVGGNIDRISIAFDYPSGTVLGFTVARPSGD